MSTAYRVREFTDHVWPEVLDSDDLTPVAEALGYRGHIDRRT